MSCECASHFHASLQEDSSTTDCYEQLEQAPRAETACLGFHLCSDAQEASL